MAGHSGRRHGPSNATMSLHEAADRSGYVITRRSTAESRRSWEDGGEDKIPDATEHIDEGENSDEEDTSLWKQRGLGARASGDEGPSGRGWDAGRASDGACRGGGGARGERGHQGENRNGFGHRNPSSSEAIGSGRLARFASLDSGFQNIKGKGEREAAVGSHRQVNMDVVDFNDESEMMDVLGGEDVANADRLFRKTRSERKVKMGDLLFLGSHEMGAAKPPKAGKGRGWDSERRLGPRPVDGAKEGGGSASVGANGGFGVKGSAGFFSRERATRVGEEEEVEMQGDGRGRGDSSVLPKIKGRNEEERERAERRNGGGEWQGGAVPLVGMVRRQARYEVEEESGGEEGGIGNEIDRERGGGRGQGKRWEVEEQEEEASSVSELRASLGQQLVAAGARVRGGVNGSGVELAGRYLRRTVSEDCRGYKGGVKLMVDVRQLEEEEEEEEEEEVEGGPIRLTPKGNTSGRLWPGAVDEVSEGEDFEEVSIDGESRGEDEEEEEEEEVEEQEEPQQELADRALQGVRQVAGFLGLSVFRQDIPSGGGGKPSILRTMSVSKESYRDEGVSNEVRLSALLSGLYTNLKPERPSAVFDTLPRYCQLAIIERLRVPHDWLNAALACKDWLKIVVSCRSAVVLHRGGRVSAEHVCSMLLQSPHVRTLILPGKSLDAPVDNDFVTVVGMACGQLEILRIGSDPEFGFLYTETGLTELFSGCPKLQELSLEGVWAAHSDGNNFRGLPESLSSLTSLKKLSLNFTNCPRSFWLPDSLGCISGLQELSLSFNIPPVVPPSLWTLLNLRVLRLTGWGGLAFLPNCLDELSSLEVLELRCADLADIPDSVERLKRIREFIWETRRSRDLHLGGSSVPASLDLLTGLQKLKLRNVWSLPDCFPPLPHLTHLEIWGAKGHFRALPDSLGGLTNLRRLDIRGSFRAVPSTLGDLVHLRSLTLLSEILEALPVTLGELSELEELCLDGCRANPLLPDALWEMATLKTLSMPCDCLPEKVGQLKKLQSLTIECDTSRSMPLNAMPSNIGALEELQKFRAVCPHMRNLPQSFTALTGLVSLQLQWNGHLPEEFGQLKNVQLLVLDSKKMAFLPDSFGQLQSLHTLVLVCERLASLPDSFVQLKNLKVLSLRGCATLTFLPENFGELRSLECMEAGCKNLSRLPESFGLLKRLRTLELFSDVVAALPDTFGLLISLHFVDFKCPKLKQAPTSVDCLPIWVQKKLASDLDGTQDQPPSFGQHLRTSRDTLLMSPFAKDSLL